jgi:hypothetical protein
MMEFTLKEGGHKKEQQLDVTACVDTIFPVGISFRHPPLS